MNWNSFLSTRNKHEKTYYEEFEGEMNEAYGKLEEQMKNYE